MRMYAEPLEHYIPVSDQIKSLDKIKGLVGV